MYSTLFNVVLNSQNDKSKKTNETDFDLNLELIQEIHLVNCRQTGTPLRD